MKSSLLSVLMFGAVLWPATTFAQTAPDAMAKAVKADNMKWEPLGDSAFEISILYTNPTTQATYLVIRGPGNQHVPRHWHSSNESITVVKGTFVVAHDGSGDKTALTPGGFAYMPAKMIHEAWTGDEGATYFITVDGKWDVNFVKVIEDIPILAKHPEAVISRHCVCRDFLEVAQLGRPMAGERMAVFHPSVTSPAVSGKGLNTTLL